MNSSTPIEWRDSTLEDHCIKVTDGSHLSPAKYDGGWPIATVENMRARHIDIPSCRTISKIDFDSLKRNSCAPIIGDVLFSKDGTIGKTFVFNQSVEVVLLSSIAIIRTNKTTLASGFLTQYLKSPFFYGEIENAKSGSAIRRIVLRDIKSLPIKLPPIKEQQKIAAILTAVDDVIESTQAQVNKLKDLKTGMMQELLTKGIGHTEFKDSPVGRIPANWKISKLGDAVVSKGLQTGPFGSQLHAHEYVEFGVPVIMPKDMKDQCVVTDSIAKITQERANELSRHKVEVGDILFSRRGDIGRCVIVREKNRGWICGTGCLKARLSNELDPGYFICYLTLSNVVEWLNNNAVGQTMLNLNTSILSELPVILPSIGEQRIIADSMNSLISTLEAKEAKLIQLNSAKKALMQDLLTGKVRVQVN